MQTKSTNLPVYKCTLGLVLHIITKTSKNFFPTLTKKKKVLLLCFIEMIFHTDLSLNSNNNKDNEPTKQNVNNIISDKN